MEHTLKQKDTWTTLLTVELGEGELKRYVADVERAAAQDIEIPGFRKGKAPLEIARQHLDSAAVLREALSRALEGSLSEAIAASGLDVMKVTDLDIKENTAQRLRYAVLLHLYPTVPAVDLAACRVERKPVTVADADVAEALETLRTSRATFTPKDGPAAEGDRVEVDFTVSLNGSVIEGGESKRHPLVIGGKNFMPGFEEALVGLRAGEEKSFTLTAPKDYYQEQLAGKTLDFKVTVQAVQLVAKPELTDEFAKSVGQFQNVEQLRAAVRQGLQAEAEQREHQRVRGAILDALLAATPIEVPPSMVQEQLDGMVADFERSLHQRGMELGMYLAHLKKTQDDLRAGWQADAERQVKIALLVHAVAKEHQISVPAAEVQQVLTEALQAAVAEGKGNVAEADVPHLERVLTERMLNERALDFLEETCAVNPGHEKTPA